MLLRFLGFAPPPAAAWPSPSSDLKADLAELRRKMRIDITTIEAKRERL